MLTFFIRRPRFAMVIALLMTFVGAVSLKLIPVEQYPQITLRSAVTGYGLASLVVVAAGFLRLLYLSGIPEAYNGFFPWLLLYVAASAGLVFAGVARFKEGLQD